MPSPEGPCVLCTECQLQGGNAVLVPNPYPVFPATGEFSGRHEVAVLSRHVTSLETASAQEVRVLAGLLQNGQERFQDEWAGSTSFISVGLEAGSSQPHLHGQVVAGPVTRSCPMMEARCSVCADLSEASQEGLILANDAATAYVPCVPGWGYEIRISTPHGDPRGGDLASIVLAAREVLLEVSRAGYEWPYNLLLHLGGHSHGHLIPRLDLGIAYSSEFGLESCTMAPHGWHFWLSNLAMRSGFSSTRS